MKYIQIFLEFQDIYSKNFNFLFDGKYKFHNKSGIYFSLFFNCFGIFLSIFFFKNEFFDYRPLTFKEIIPFHLSSNKLFIEKSSLLFFFSFYLNEEIIDVESILDIEVNDNIKKYFIIEKNNSCNFNKNSFFNYCIYNDKSFYLNEDFFPIEIKIIKKINNLTSNLKLMINYSNYYINIYNYSFPFQKITNSINVNLDFNHQKILKGEIKKIGLKNDNGIIFKKKNVFNEHIKMRNNYIETNILNDNNIFLYQISFSHLSTIIHRRYQKIQETISIIIAILIFFSLCFYVILSSYQNKINEYKITNSIFKFFSYKKHILKNSAFKLYKICDNKNKFNESTIYGFKQIKKSNVNYLNNNRGNSYKNPLIKSKSFISNDNLYLDGNIQGNVENSAIFKGDKYSVFLYKLNLNNLRFCKKKNQYFKREYTHVQKELMKNIDFKEFIKHIFDIEKIKFILVNHKICEYWNPTKKYINIDNLSLLHLKTKSNTSKIKLMPKTQISVRSVNSNNKLNNPIELLNCNNTEKKVIFENNLLKLNQNNNLNYDLKRILDYNDVKSI